MVTDVAAHKMLLVLNMATHPRLMVTDVAAHKRLLVLNMATHPRLLVTDVASMLNSATGTPLAATCGANMAAG